MQDQDTTSQHQNQDKDETKIVKILSWEQDSNL